MSSLEYFPHKQIVEHYLNWDKPLGYTDIFDSRLIQNFYENVLESPNPWDFTKKIKTFVLEFPFTTGRTNKKTYDETQFLEFLNTVIKTKINTIKNQDQIDKLNQELQINKGYALARMNKTQATQLEDLKRELEECNKELAKEKTKHAQINAQHKKILDSLKKEHEDRLIDKERIIRFQDKEIIELKAKNEELTLQNTELLSVINPEQLEKML